jgi:hypothetical protein
MTLIDDTIETKVGSAPPTGDQEGSIRGRVSRIDWTYEGGFLVVLVGAVALALSVVGRRSGWLIGQTPPDPLLVQIYAAHFRHGDLYPVWSSSDAYGMGTPVLLFYQRTFFMVGGVVFIILGGSLKATMVVTLGIFLVIGAYGMRMALAMITESRLLRTTGAIGFLFTNWTFSEWLIRGDLAEFAAMMIVPWLLYWCLKLVRDRWFSWSIVPIMVSLIWAHNTIGLMSGVVIGVSGAVFLILYGSEGVRSVARRLVASVGATVLILAPGLVAEVKMGKYYDPAKTIISDNNFIHSFTFANPTAFLYDPAVHWLRSGGVPFGVKIQLDFAITALLALGLVTLLVFTVKRFVRGSASSEPQMSRALLAVVIVSGLIYLVLQFRISLPLWNAFWQLKVIGYPFRMMSFLTPLALILAVIVADWYRRFFRIRRPSGSPWVPRALAAAWLLCLIVLSPVTAHAPAPKPGLLPYLPFTPIDLLTAQPNATFRTSWATPLFPEYLPVVRQADGSDSVNVAPTYRHLQLTHTEAASLSSVPCSVTELSGTSFESLQITYRVICRGPTEVALPISYNSFTSLDEITPHRAAEPVPVFHVPTDPRIVIRIRTGGTHVIVARLPTLFGILF